MAVDPATLIWVNHDMSPKQLLTGTSEDTIDDGSGFAVRKTPSRQDWEDHRALITRHYMTENQPLRVVRRIMAGQYGFFATTRMYKQRIQAWKLWKHWPRRHLRTAHEAGPTRSDLGVLGTKGQPVSLRKLSIHVARSQSDRRHQRRSMSSSSVGSNTVPEVVEPPITSSPSYSETNNDIENTLRSLILTRPMTLPDQDRYLQIILSNVDEYCRSCFRNQGRLFANQVLGSVGVSLSFKDVADDYAEMGLRKVHDAGYAAISLAKSQQYREARILLGEAQDKVKNLLKAQHPTLLPFILEIICENSTTPQFNVSKWFHRYVCDLCSIIMPKQPWLTTILQLLGLMDFKLETCARILSRIQAILGAEFGANQWQARRPVKVFCRVLRHLGRYDEVEKMLPTSVGDYGNLVEKPTLSESLGLLYEWAWLSARGRHDNLAATEHFREILRRTDRDAQLGRISHFRLKALRGLGILAREESRHELSERYFSAALHEARQGRFDRRDSNTVRIASELEESLRTLGRFDEADRLRRERDELFWDEDEAREVWRAQNALFAANGTGFVFGDEEAVEV